MRNSMMISSIIAIFIFTIIPLPITCTSSHLLPLKKSNHIFMVGQQDQQEMITMINNNNNNNHDLIESTCKNTPNYQLCITTLESDPRSLDPNTSVFGLGLIVVDALKNKATATMEKINRLKGSNIPDFAIPVMECSMMYNAILKADIPVAIEGLRKGVPKFAESGMDDAALEVQNCDNSFKKQVKYSPISGMNQDVYDLSLVAKSIIRLLL
ncbi:OLC1v1020699C1 [Oldenlandia corymbosa var. corymbosa]|uniref:OLC1v1020699C1 n=1 Tax=Oldenlandia corymbosa var. corymbosa TaxID=529605 RepID=A0AAV1EH12_OLDCO|nr:OLC1v1020699C1 [Oldenlandia corymbosa var. corymbosa]